MTTYSESLCVRAIQAQAEALKSVCFEELMTRISQAYNLEKLSANHVFQDEPDKLKEEIDLWQGLIDVSKKAIAANKQAFAIAQLCPDLETAEALMESELKAFIEANNPGFEMYMQDGDWWADVEY